MIARLESWSARSSDAALAAAIGVALFAGTFALLHIGPLGHFQIIDTPVYERYGGAVVDGGQVPYLDFGLEYPPGALPAFILPALAPADGFRTAFELLMALCGVGMVALVVYALAAAGATRGRMIGAAIFTGLAPLALGTVVLTRYDLWPALLTAGVMASLASDRHRLGAGLLAAAVAAKIYPVVLLPIALVYISRRRDGREAAACLAVFIGVLAAIVLPFAIVAPDGLQFALERQTGRPLQIESLGASLLLAAGQLGLGDPAVVSSHGSQNLSGSAADTLATLQAVLQALAVVAVWVLFATRSVSREVLFAGSAAAVCAFVAFGKVLSPQYMIWLVPLVPLVAGSVGLAASGLLLAALILTHLWFPSRYWDIVAFDGFPTWLLVGRNVVLVALTAVLVVGVTRERARARSSWPARHPHTR